MSLIRWEPFRDVMTLRQAADRLFDESLLRFPMRSSVLAQWEGVPVDVYQTDSDFVVKAAIPGAKPEDVEVTITGDTLIIKGESRDEREVKEESFIHREQRYGTFSRSVLLPSHVKSDKAEASFENGMLTITVPKAEESKTKSIKVKVQKLIEGKKP